MVTLKIVQIGNSLGVVLPKEALNKMKVEKGDNIYLVENSDGSFNITPYDPEFERQMESVQKIMKKDYNVLKELSRN